MKTTAKKEALDLRTKGFSIIEIAKVLHVAKSTAYEWTKSLQIKLKSGSDKGYLKDKARQRRESAIENGFSLAEKSEKFRLLSAIYWCEGYKGNCFRVTNCDHRLLRLVWDWLCETNYDAKVTFYLTHWAEKSDEELKTWWLEKLPGLTANQFRKFSVKQKGKTCKWPYGVGSINVNSVDLRFMAEGGMKFLAGLNCTN